MPLKPMDLLRWHSVGRKKPFFTHDDSHRNRPEKQRTVMYRILILLPIFLLAAFSLQAQQDEPSPPEVKIYSTSGGELIFSFADVSNPFEDIATNLRFSGFLHLSELWHFDFTDNFGMFTGVALRNVGIITKDDGILIRKHTRFLTPETEDVKIKRRSYSLGVPLAMKLGDFNRGVFFFFGGEAELMFHYKEKLFIDGDKEHKFNEWFSKRTNLINPSVFGGVQFRRGMNVRFKYYLLDFLNQDYRERIDGNVVRPYQELQTQMFYISLAWNLRSGRKSRSTSTDVERRT
jgi:hypothetical protein